MSSSLFIPSQHTLKELEDMLTRLAGQVETASVEWARTAGDYEALRLFEKPTLNSAMPSTGTEVERKRIAYTSDAYTKHLEGQAQAYRDMMTAEAKYKSALTKYEALKSVVLKRFGSS